MTYVNHRKMSDAGPKTFQHCRERTAKGEYVDLTRTVRAWFCARCAPKMKRT